MSDTRIFYRESPKEVVVLRDGIEIAKYRSPEQLIEVHMKGLIARDKQEAQQVRQIYRPEPPTE